MISFLQYPQSQDYKLFLASAVMLLKKRAYLPNVDTKPFIEGTLKFFIFSSKKYQTGSPVPMLIYMWVVSPLLGCSRE